MDIQLFIPCTDSDGVFTIEHTASGDFDDADLLVMVRNVVEAHRALMDEGVSFHGAVVVERAGPLGARSKMRAYASNDYDRILSGDDFRGVAKGEPLGRFVELWEAAGTVEGEPFIHPVPHGVTSVDLYPLWEQRVLSLDPEAPLWSIRAPLFHAWTQGLSGLDVVQIKDNGDALPTGVVRSYKPVYAVYKWKLHQLQQTRAAHAETFRVNILRHTRAAQVAAHEYTLMMSRFSGNWGDNKVPDYPNLDSQLWGNAIWAASAWYHVARRMGYTNVPPERVTPEPNSFVGGARFGYLDNYEATALHRRATLVKAIAQRLYQCQRTLESCVLRLQNSNANKVYKDMVLEGRALWFTEVETSGGNPRRIYLRSDPPEDRVFDGIITGFIHTRCFEQHMLEAQWETLGGAALASLYYTLFPAMSAALFEILALTTLLPCVFDTAAQSVKAFEDAGFERTKLTQFPRRDATPEDYTLQGDACDYVQLVPWRRGNFETTVFACTDEIVTLRVPRKPAPHRTFPWNPTTDPDPRDNAFQAWLAGDLVRARDDVARDAAGFWRQWDRTVNNAIDATINAVEF